MKSRKFLYAFIVIFVSALIFVLLNFGTTSSVKTPEPEGGDKVGISFKNLFGLASFFKEDMDVKKVIADDPEIERVIELLKEKYGKKLSDKRLQIKLLGALIRHLKKKNPYDWKERIRAVVSAEFPAYSVELADKLDKLDEYNNYLKENRGELQALGRAEKKQKMLEKRREIFGPECDEIWEQEIISEKLSDILVQLDGRTDLSVYDKMKAYNNTAKSLYPEAPDISSAKTGDEIMVRNYELTNNFLELGSVQADLGTMAPADRTAFLRKLRESMGLKEDVIKKMEETDAIRDKLWERGPHYNNERNKILADYDGDERNAKLDEARKKYFGPYANIIKFEEETFKFNRFQLPRRWGRD
ncbi:MAG: hypothetical protein A2W19_15370 [Spirochaetes bacterium RBG_16_49_21]|nr:MAG: hypothetical protein A2W19_15370 [Spirochaetes bacterium RBG_16_49_21]